MKRKLEEKLFNEFPELFRGKDESLRHNLMCFGFECGDGWFDLIRHLCKKITEFDPKKIVKAVQIKEKFGGLRFYIGGAPGIIFRLILDAEEKSFEICELCGKDGSLAFNGWWLKTLCPECIKEIEKERGFHYEYCKENEEES